MSEKRKFWVVWGGVFKDMTFQELEPGTEQLLGPFPDEAAALLAWRDGTRRQVDIATHRLFVMLAKETGPQS